jgi:hypothetical protein
VAVDESEQLTLGKVGIVDEDDECIHGQFSIVVIDR